MEKLPEDEDKAVLTELLDSCYKYSLAMNEHAQEHPFPSESLIITLLLTQHKVITRLKSIIESKQTDNRPIHLGPQQNVCERKDDGKIP